MRLAHLRVGVPGHLLGVGGAHHALGLEPLRVELAHRRVLLDQLVHLRLRVGGLVGLVVAEAAVADQVDERVAAEGLAEVGGEPHGRDAGLDVIRVHVDDRHVEALGRVGGVARRAALLRIGREAELVVGDHVDRAAGGVAGQRLQVERLGDDALPGEGGVAVDQHRHDRGGIVGEVARLAARLVGACAALDHGVDVLEVARVGGERHGHAAPRARRVGAAGAVVVLDVAGAALGRGGVDRERLLALELGEDRLVGTADRVRQHVEPAAVRHPEHDLARALGGGDLDHLVEHRHERVEALDRELLLAEEGLVQVVLERLHLRQPLQQPAPGLLGKRLAVAAALDRLPQPDALLVVRDVLDLIGDRARVGLAQAGQRLGERVARHRDAQHRGRDAAHQLLGQVDRGGIERGIADGGRAERVELRGEVAVHAVRLDD